MRLMAATVFGLAAGWTVLAMVAKPQGNAILGLWTTEDGRARIAIVEDKGVYSGTIVWLKEPTYTADDAEAGQPRHDRHNPDPAKQHRPILGLALIEGFVFDGDGTWVNGTIYDPENGKTYKCKLTLVESDKLHVRGYIGFSLIGRTTVWTRYNVESNPKEKQRPIEKPAS